MATLRSAVPARMQRGLQPRVVCYVHSNGQASQKVKVKFMLPKKVSYGQSVMLLGSKPELGAWDPAGSPLVLEWHEGHQWTAECELPAGEEVEYKYVVRGKGGVLEWQPGGNISLSLPVPGAALVQVVDDWHQETHEVQVDGAVDEALVGVLEGEEPLQPSSAADPPATEAAAAAASEGTSPTQHTEAAAAPAAEAAAPAASSSASSSNGATATSTGVAERPAEAREGLNGAAGRSKNTPVGGTAVLTKPLEEMTVKQLKELAKEYKVGVGGRKMDLIDRIKGAMANSE